MHADGHPPGGHPAVTAQTVIDGIASGATASTFDRLASIGDPAELRSLIESVAATSVGLRALLGLRAGILATAAPTEDRAGVAAMLEAALAHRFAPPSLELRVIDATAPPVVLDAVVANDSVHPIRGDVDLHRRLHPVDRRCFALVNPTLGPRPLVFTEVALTTGIETSVEAILDAPAPDGPIPVDTAMFYAIVKCEPGLRGIAVGAELLHRAMAELADTTSATVFCTLSPLPGLAAWADTEPDEQQELLATAARYLLTARRGDEPLDPVARFHLGNGARIEQINAAGNRLAGGGTSLGLTVNYLYDRDALRANQAAYDQGEVVASPAVRSLLKGP